MADPLLRPQGTTLPNVRPLLLVPVAVISVLVMHGLADAGTPFVHAQVEHSMSSHDSAPEHSTSHLAAMSICAFALLVAVHQIRRSGSPRRMLGQSLSTWAVRIATGPEPPVPRSVV